MFIKYVEKLRSIRFGLWPTTNETKENLHNRLIKPEPFGAAQPLGDVLHGKLITIPLVLPRGKNLAYRLSTTDNTYNTRMIVQIRH